MDYKIIVTEDAHADIDETVDYIINKLENLTAATALLDKIVNVYGELASNPYMYAQCSDEWLRSKGYRKAIVNNYIIVYRVDEKEKIVYILRVFYGRRDYAKLI